MKGVRPRLTSPHPCLHTVAQYSAGAVILLSVWVMTGEAHALHPTNFPHQHIAHPTPDEHEAPHSAETDPLERRLRAYVGVGLVGGGLIPDGAQLADGLGGGGGFELFLGGRFNQWVGADLEWTTTIHGTGGDPGFRVDAALLSTLSGLVRVYMTCPQFLEPYAAIGISLITTDGGPQSSLSIMGLGFTAGFGLDMYLTDDVVLGLKALYRGGFLDNSAERVDHLPDFPDEASFISLITGSAHVRLSF